MSKQNIKARLIKLGTTRPQLREHLRPILAYIDGVDDLETRLKKISPRTQNVPSSLPYEQAAWALLHLLQTDKIPRNTREILVQKVTGRRLMHLLDEGGGYLERMEGDDSPPILDLMQTWIIKQVPKLP